MHRGPAPSPSSAALDVGSALVLWMGLIGCLLVALGIVGCGRDVRVELLEITAIGPDRIEPGRRIEIDGRGFPVGADATLHLRGTLHQPGRAHDVELSIPVEIDAVEHAEALVTGAMLDELGDDGRGTFRGEATLLVPMANDAHGVVSGTFSDLVLDLRPSADDDRALDTRELDAWWGLTLAEDPELGLRVTEVDPAGRAAALGVAEGDALIGVDGMRIFDARDLSGWTETPVRLEVDRGHGGVVLGARVEPDVLPDPSLRAVQLAALLIIVALALAERDRPARRRARTRISPQGLLLVAAALALLQRCAHGLDADRMSMLLAPVFAAVVIATSVTGHALRSPWVVASGFARALGLLGVVLLSALGRGTIDLEELERTQSLAPTDWALLATPVAPALVVLLALSLPPAAPATASLGARILNRATEIAVSALVVLCLAGGRGSETPLGILSFCVRGLLVFGCLGWTRATLGRWPWQGRALAALLSLGAAIGAAVLRPDPGAGWSEGAAEVWLAALAIVALLQLRPRPEPALHAELAL